jgi:hypothetical protein
VACGTALLVVQAALAQQAGTSGPPADVAAVRAAASAYREALAKGDAAAVKAAWVAEGDIVDGWGNRLRPDEITAADRGPAAANRPRPEFRSSETDLRFITADVAVEDGTVDVVLPGMQTSIEGWFSALWVRSGGSWKLAGLRESERPVVADSEMLADLDWMVGDWTLTVEEAGGAKGADSSAREPATAMSVRWDPGRAFLVREVRTPTAATEGDAGVVETGEEHGSASAKTHVAGEYVLGCVMRAPIRRLGVFSDSAVACTFGSQKNVKKGRSMRHKEQRVHEREWSPNTK